MPVFSWVNRSQATGHETKVVHQKKICLTTNKLPWKAADSLAACQLHSPSWPSLSSQPFTLVSRMLFSSRPQAQAINREPNIAQVPEKSHVRRGHINCLNSGLRPPDLNCGQCMLQSFKITEGAVQIALLMLLSISAKVILCLTIFTMFPSCWRQHCRASQMRRKRYRWPCWQLPLRCV